MSPVEQDDIGTGIDALEQAIRKFEKEPSDANRHELHAEARGLRGAFVDESMFEKKVDPRHENIKHLFNRASDLMAKNPDALSNQVAGYAAEIMDLSVEKIRQLVAPAKVLK